MKRVYELDCWPEAIEMLKEGTTVAAVAKWIQVDNQEYTHVKRDSLERQIYRWMEDAPELTSALPQRIITNRIEKLDIGLDALREMEKLLVMQLKRVEMGFEMEKQVGLLMPDATGVEQERAFHELREYIETLQALGLKPKAPEKLLIGGAFANFHQAAPDDETLAKLANLSPDILEDLMRIEQRMNENVVDATDVREIATSDDE